MVCRSDILIYWQATERSFISLSQIANSGFFFGSDPHPDISWQFL
jgi:hypothetical protein